MVIHITSNGVPIYLQIVEQVRALIATARLVAGEELPPIRVLAEQLLINPNTVARAYLELENESLVVKRHGSGTYVSDGARPAGKKELTGQLENDINQLLATADQLGLSVENVVEQIKKQGRENRKKRG